MKKFATLFFGSALTALIASTALAASTVPADSRDANKSAAVAEGSSTPAVTVVPVVSAATAAPLQVPAADPKAQSVKIGYIDMAVIAAETDRGKAVTAALKARSAKLSAKLEAKQKQIEKQKAAIQAKIESLSLKERQAKAKEFQRKMEEYQKLARSSDLEMQELQEKLTTDLFKEIKKTAVAYGKSNGYAAVLVKKEVLYLADTLELKEVTEDISAVLNQKPKAN